MAITFLCTGNTCRSPMAEAIAERFADEIRLRGGNDRIFVRSAGTGAYPGASASGGARRVASAAGLDLDNHRSAPVAEELVGTSDLVICMESHHVARARELAGAVPGKGRDTVRLFRDESGLDVQVSDPFGMGDDDYRQTFRQLEALVGGLFASLFTEGFARFGSGSSYALLGDPVGHSLSPVLHNAVFRQVPCDAVYWARPTSRRECGPVLRALALAGGGGNVTVPLKEVAVPFVDRPSDAVLGTGACNTFWAEDGVVRGDNTDVRGFLASWAQVVGPVLGSRVRPRVLVLGAGGASRAVLYALLQEDLAERIDLWNRTGDRAVGVADHFADDRLRAVEAWEGTVPDVVVNATSAGIDGKNAPLDLERLGARPRALIDLVYGREPTLLVKQAEAMKIAAADGREMLVRQAEASYQCWFGEEAPSGAMSDALR